MYGIRQTLKKYFEMAVSPESGREFVERIFNLTMHYNFDGVYLDINVENSSERYFFVDFEDLKHAILLILQQIF